MKLPHALEGIMERKLDKAQLLQAVQERRRVLRKIRDTRGDHRCWTDVYWLYAFLTDSEPTPKQLPSYKDAMARCTSFFKNCRTKTADKVPESAVLDPELWDADLKKKSKFWVLLELNALQIAIRDFRDVRHPHTVQDYRNLFGLLPENVPCDFRLPPRKDFLGVAKAPKAGCPAFWRSHRKGKKIRHNIHCWGKDCCK